MPYRPEIDEPIDPSYVRSGFGMAPVPLEFTASSAPLLQSLAETLGIENPRVSPDAVHLQHPVRQLADRLGNLMRLGREARVKELLRQARGSESAAPIFGIRPLPAIRNMLNLPANLPRRILDSIIDYGVHVTDPRTLDELSKTPVEDVAPANWPASPAAEIARRTYAATRSQTASAVAHTFAKLRPERRKQLAAMNSGMVMILPDGTALLKDADGTLKLISDENRVFHSEGPDLYADAYARNRQFAKPGPYQTALPPPAEQQFRAWVAKNRVPFDPDAKTVDYDMRGYWRAMNTGQAKPWKGGVAHFPDTFKTPYDTTFSSESMYATPNNPFVWRGDDLIDKNTGEVLFSPER